MNHGEDALRALEISSTRDWVHAVNEDPSEDPSDRHTSRSAYEVIDEIDPCVSVSLAVRNYGGEGPGARAPRRIRGSSS